LLAAGRFQYKVVAVVALKAHDGRCRGTEHSHSYMRGLLKPASQQSRIFQRIIQFGTTHQYVGERTERRIVHPAAVTEFFIVETAEVMLGSKLHSIMIGKVRLENNLARSATAPGPPRNLRQELERALSSAEVRQTERNVRPYHSHQGHSVHVMALGNHLCAHQ